MKKTSLGTVLLLAALPAISHADDTALAKCRAVTEAGARPACYDAIPLAAAAFKSAPAAPAAAAGSAIPAPVAKVSGASYEASLTATPPPPPTPAPAAKVTAKAYSASVAATPAPAEESAQPAATASAKQAEQFGMENVRPKEQLDKIESSIAGAFEGWVPHQRIRLANGQVWQIADDSTHWMSVENPKVVIWRGLLGVFYLNIGNLNQAPRVERVK